MGSEIGPGKGPDKQRWSGFAHWRRIAATSLCESSDGAPLLAEAKLSLMVGPEGGPQGVCSAMRFFPISVT